MDLIEKALRLYDEIECHQKQLRDILIRIQAMHDEPSSMHDARCTMHGASCINERASRIENKRPDLWKSLTINDRFRFRRELFAGDDAAMSEAINHISEMNSLSEADDYLSSMPWESDSEAVTEFMTILSNYFSRF